MQRLGGRPSTDSIWNTFLSGYNLQRFLFKSRGLSGWLPEVLFQIHAELYKRDAFTFEKFSLKQSVGPTNQDFAAIAYDAVPRDPFSGWGGGHGASGCARAARQA